MFERILKAREILNMFGLLKGVDMRGGFAFVAEIPEAVRRRHSSFQLSRSIHVFTDSKLHIYRDELRKRNHHALTGEHLAQIDRTQLG